MYAGLVGPVTGAVTDGIDPYHHIGTGVIEISVDTVR